LGIFAQTHPSSRREKKHKPLFKGLVFHRHPLNKRVPVFFERADVTPAHSGGCWRFYVPNKDGW